ncbi:hypothetical protein [Saccharothrix hoggarensis]|uniref:Uncharacterized protein n=1 Tax=Saccharothrix hoggarensis TaxID=913853 RepID=A0ABW3QPT7_9PSEU
MRKVTLTGRADVLPIGYALVGAIPPVGDGMIGDRGRPNETRNGYAHSLKDFSAVASNARTSCFDDTFDRIFSTALNRFSITLSSHAAGRPVATGAAGAHRTGPRRRAPAG